MNIPTSSRSQKWVEGECHENKIKSWKRVSEIFDMGATESKSSNGKKKVLDFGKILVPEKCADLPSDLSKKLENCRKDVSGKDILSWNALKAMEILIFKETGKKLPQVLKTMVSNYLPMRWSYNDIIFNLFYEKHVKSYKIEYFPFNFQKYVISKQNHVFLGKLKFVL